MYNYLIDTVVYFHPHRSSYIKSANQLINKQIVPLTSQSYHFTKPGPTDSILYVPADPQKEGQDPAGAESLSPPTYDSWVMISNQSNPANTTTPDTADMSPPRDTGASQVLFSKGLRVSDKV